jgi:hypothetical protein
VKAATKFDSVYQKAFSAGEHDGRVYCGRRGRRVHTRLLEKNGVAAAV